MLNRELLDEVIAVSDDDAIQHGLDVREARRPARGHLLRRRAVGARCRSPRARSPAGKRIVVIMPDSGERYVSQAFFAP